MKKWNKKSFITCLYWPLGKNTQITLKGQFLTADTRLKPTDPGQKQPGKREKQYEEKEDKTEGMSRSLFVF